MLSSSLERHQPTEKLFGVTVHCPLLQAGTIVYATIISAPSQTKNATGTSAPEMHQTKKGKLLYFGMQAYMGTNLKGIVHRVIGTGETVAGSSQLDQLLRGTESVFYGDLAYDSDDNQRMFAADRVRYRIQRAANTR